MTHINGFIKLLRLNNNQFVALSENRVIGKAYLRPRGKHCFPEQSLLFSNHNAALASGLKVQKPPKA